MQTATSNSNNGSARAAGSMFGDRISRLRNRAHCSVLIAR
jgi:hypothetical protein